MRISAWIVSGLFASYAAMPASAGAAYALCIEAANPPECLARRALASSSVARSHGLAPVLNHGLVDLVPALSAMLIRRLYLQVGEPEVRTYSPWTQVLDVEPGASLRHSTRPSLLAAMALVAAARHETDPFANPVYRALAQKAQNDPQIPALAMALWLNVVGTYITEPDLRVSFAGLPVIWDRALTRREQDPELLANIAGTPEFVDKLKPRAKEFFAWYAQRPGLTEYQRVSTASRLVRLFDMPEKAESVLGNLGVGVNAWQLPGVRSEIAMARLKRGYDTFYAGQLLYVFFIHFEIAAIRLFEIESGMGGPLEHSGARDELREIGAEYLRHAEAPDAMFQADLYASASDLFLRAGDREYAREIARRGLPYVPKQVGTAPVIALYRTGAIEEALKTRYLTGYNRYLNAERAGEKPDPQWVLDDKLAEQIPFMVGDAERSTDRDFQERAYEGLWRSCGEPPAVCNEETLRQIAQVAAGMGDEPGMKKALTVATRQLDEGKNKEFPALYTAATWEHCKDVLRGAQPHDTTR
jgi:hypothetical protein